MTPIALEELVDAEIVAQHGPFVMLPTSVAVTDDASYDQWADAFQWCQKVEKGSAFWVGDLLAYGDKFGEEATQVLEATEYAEKTLSNAKYTCKAIPPERRNANVPYAHHHEIAALPTEAEQDAWLKKCEAENLSRDQLRVQLKAHKAQTTGVTVELWVNVRCTDVADQTEFADQMSKAGRSFVLKAKEIG